MKLKLIFLIITLVQIFFISDLFAAQDAMTTVEQAPIRERPTHDSKILESKAAGAKLRVSSFNKDGWYKTKSSSGQYGWIWQADMSILAHKNDVKAANLELKETEHERRFERHDPKFFIKAGGFVFGATANDVSRRLDQKAAHLYYLLGFFLEPSIRIDDGIRIALRTMYYSGRGKVQSASLPYIVEFSGIPVLLGLDTDVLPGEKFNLTAGFYAGLGFKSNITVTADGASNPNSFFLQSTYFAAMFNFGAKYWLSQKLAFVSELGVYYTRLRQRLPKSFNGDGPFREQTGNLAELTINHLGPVFTLGLQFGF